MGASAFPVIIMSLFWGGVGIVLPFLVPKGPNRGIIQCVLMLTGACCWLFWLCCYMAQMNPLIGPKIENKTLLLMAREWGNPVE
ncbi:V-type proton ATPase subunit e 2-like [Macrosteles quadrilineatus]|uniref:V-type proton ATPase subunit e 2-like n=1 Tax=Macrosteles quadrilineatus TaxID=74068 RepID=UPI0023E29B70|nr:V-type proton ATPase subunit e 2-like [Macrosteles quadrilineatus]XP_054261502.1 V-type proton ATPase subunit e 2-like [Macrosteles quadrilineatus]